MVLGYAALRLLGALSLFGSMAASCKDKLLTPTQRSPARPAERWHCTESLLSVCCGLSISPGQPIFEATCMARAVRD